MGRAGRERRTGRGEREEEDGEKKTRRTGRREKDVERGQESGERG